MYVKIFLTINIKFLMQNKQHHVIKAVMQQDAAGAGTASYPQQASEAPGGII